MRGRSAGDAVVEAIIAMTKKVAPELRAFQEKLRVIEAEIGEVTASLAKKEFDKETARERMLPLLKEEREIQNDPEFLVEQRLAQVYFSSPRYRAKTEKIMRAQAAKRRARP